MQNQQQPKLFAFKLAEQQSKETKPAQAWQVREAVSTAGCSYVDVREVMLRNMERYTGADTGFYC